MTSTRYTLHVPTHAHTFIHKCRFGIAELLIDPYELRQYREAIRRDCIARNLPVPVYANTAATTATTSGTNTNSTATAAADTGDFQRDGHMPAGNTNSHASFMFKRVVVGCMLAWCRALIIKHHVPFNADSASSWS